MKVNRLIRKISEKILNYLINSKVISDTEDNREFYQYGIEITISSLLNIVLILCIGILTHSISESMIFLVCFILLRQFTGGFHADTYFKCNLSFCIVFSIVLVLYYTTAQYLSTYISILLTFVCVSIILAKCPIEHINKPIQKNRKIIHKILTALLGTVYGAVGTVLTAFSNRYGALIIYTLSLVTVLVLVAIIKERWDKHESNKENQ